MRTLIIIFATTVLTLISIAAAETPREQTKVVSRVTERLF